MSRRIIQSVNGEPVHQTLQGLDIAKIVGNKFALTADGQLYENDSSDWMPVGLSQVSALLSIK